MFEHEQSLLREHFAERSVKEYTSQAREDIAYNILRGNGHRICGTVWTFASIIEQIIEHGQSTDLAARLHAVTSSTNPDARSEAVYELVNWLEARVEEHIPERLVEAEARDLESEAALCDAEVTHKAQVAV